MSQRHPATETIQTSQTERPSEAVVSAVADAEGLDPIALETPLYEVVDPDALDDLIPLRANDAHSAQVRFTYYGYEVQIHGNGKVVLERE